MQDLAAQSDQPETVSIWMVTYNHERYISHAIEGVLMQQTTFNYKLIIGEDCSLDNTRNIVIDYKNRFPDRIQLFLPDMNLGMMKMVKATYNLCTAPYIACLDGDDYWTDPYKLQKQVDFLKANPGFVFCFHEVLTINEITGSSDYIKIINSNDENYVFTVPDFLAGNNPVPTSSLVYRNVLGKDLPEWYYDMPYPDLAFYFLLLEHGNAKLLPGQMAIYRIHSGGAWSGNSYYYNISKLTHFFRLLNKNLNYTYHNQISEIVDHYSYQLFKTALSERNYKGIVQHSPVIFRKGIRIIMRDKNNFRRNIQLLGKIMFRTK